MGRSVAPLFTFTEEEIALLPSSGEVLAYNHDTLVRRFPDGRPDHSDPEFCPVLWR